jgi:hypothetical protein
MSGHSEFVMYEYIARTLADVSRAEQLDGTLLLRLIRGTASGLAHLHSHAVRVCCACVLHD